ncbi:branched-chain amino acid ABC transporter permease [Nitratidesulfovibrio sp.]|uniref:branched-chain amino acid ABC transporter permease n=1 Tax=Nitratidesulfovibrio sp. TaxID=2802297 RepID=UPI003341CD3E
MDPVFLAQDCINGVLMGLIYGLVALGLTLIFGVLKVINFAHGSFLMVGMYVAYWTVTLSGLSPYPALVIIIPAMFLFGYWVQHLLIRPIFIAEKNVREPITVIIVTTGLWYVLDNLALLVFGPDYRALHPNPLKGQMLEMGEIFVSVPKLYGAMATLATAGGLHLFLQHTRLGRAVRATSLDREAASLMGIGQWKIFNIAFGIGTAVAGISGAVLTPFYNVYPTVGIPFDIKSFVIVVLGGLGSIWGALVGGVIIGLIESIGPNFMTSTWTEGIVYALFLLVLFVKPSGLFGQKQDW